MSLRVIAGSARGMKLKRVPGDNTRPITDRVKESLFNILGADIRGARFLDLFAGTGSVGIEALSRGAEFAHFNELNRLAVRTIRQNIAHTGFTDKARVTRRDAFHLIARKPEKLLHFIFVAPPQYRGIWLETLRAFDRNSAWHHPGSRIIVQIDPSEFDAGQRFMSLDEIDRRAYGRTMLLFYRFAVLGEDIQS